MKEELRHNVHHDFAIEALRAGVRVDGRPLDRPRELKIELGPAFGQASVSLGRTVAMAFAKAEPITPYPDRPSEGMLSISVELSATSSEPAAVDFAVLGANPASDRSSMALRGVVERVIRDARALDTEALCILAGKKVWSVSVEVSVIDASGNCVDAALLAAMGALLHARRNDVSISGTDVHIHPLSEREPLPLPIHHVPLTVSYALFGRTPDFPDDVAAMDPSLQEELASDGSLTIALNSLGEVCGLHKAGGVPVNSALVTRCARVAEDRVIELTKAVNKALEASSAKHHPLTTVRSVPVAKTPTALLPGKRNAGEAENAAMEDAEMKVESANQPFQGGGSMWNAVPIDEAPPDAPAPGPTPAPGKDDDRMEDDVVLEIFDSVKAEKSAPNTGGARNGSSASRSSAQANTLKPTKKARDVSDSDSPDDSDDDLANAVIAMPKGGGARRAKPKPKKGR